MTREEAIEELERLLRHWDLIDEGIYDLSEHDKDAVEIALTALRPVSRERVEKVWRREWRWVGEDRWSDTYECSKCGKLSMNDYPFCPNCNSAMNDEAVEMVMERLNKLEETKK